MTTYEAIQKIIQASADDDLVEAERVLDRYFEERKKEELMRGMERIDHGSYFSLERKIPSKQP